MRRPVAGSRGLLARRRRQTSSRGAGEIGPPIDRRSAREGSRVGNACRQLGLSKVMTSSDDDPVLQFVDLVLYDLAFGGPMYVGRRPSIRAFRDSSGAFEMLVASIEQVASVSQSSSWSTGAYEIPTIAPPVTAAWPPSDPTAPAAVGAAARIRPARALVPQGPPPRRPRRRTRC